METTFAKLEIGAEFRFFGEIEPSPNYDDCHKGVKRKTSKNTYQIIESDYHPIFNGRTYDLQSKSLGVQVVKLVAGELRGRYPEEKAALISVLVDETTAGSNPA